MKIQALQQNKTYINNSLPKQSAFQSGGGIIDDGDYVKIPKKKYKRDQFIENCFVGVLIAIALIKFFFDRPKFP